MIKVEKPLIVLVVASAPSKFFSDPTLLDDESFEPLPPKRRAPIFFPADRGLRKACARGYTMPPKKRAR